MQNLQSTDYVQNNLLIPYNSGHRQEQLVKTIDKLNKRYGSGTISWAACKLKRSYKQISSEHLSHAATTRIQEIPIVKA